VGKDSQGDLPTFSERTDLSLFPRIGEWTSVLWPEYFVPYDAPICQSLSQSLNTLVSTIHVFDSDYWVHHLFSGGDLLDRFCSWPSYFVKERTEVSRLRREWSGKPEVVADAFGVSPSVVAPYFAHQDLTSAKRGKVHDDDRLLLEDFWVFTDLWRRLGIHYQYDPDAAEIRIRLGGDFPSKLPTIGSADL
jgi:hypothetical protein